MYRDLRVAVVVPAYNEEQLIGVTLAGIPDYVDRVFVVDDCSVDNTGKVILEHQEKDPRIEVVCHEKNSGVGAAIISGYRRVLEEACAECKNDLVQDMIHVLTSFCDKLYEATEVIQSAIIQD